MTIVFLVGLVGCGRIGVRWVVVDDADPNEPTSCSGVCEVEHGALDCTGGDGDHCSVSCANGYANCDAVSSNGCEVSTMDTLDSCGACDLACANEHGSAACVRGVCVPECAAGYGDCDSNLLNGCETSLSDTDHCGACDRACVNAHGSTTCALAQCMPACEAGYGDCDGAPENGCETNLQSNPTHCGACGGSCDVEREVCAGGRCEPSPCGPGRGECDGNAEAACETDLANSDANCGFCDNVCAAVNGSAMCADGSCRVSECSDGYADCDGVYDNGCEEVLASSLGHCGACGASCSNEHGATSCNAGRCVPACSSGYGDCDGDPSNGCETGLDVTTDCGMCGRACEANGGTPICNDGVCSTLCDLSGRFALKLSVPTTWPGTSVLSAGSGTFVFWAQLQLSQDGSMLSGSLVPCGESVPDFSTVAFLNETYHVTLATDALDRVPPFPSTSIRAALSATTPGSGIAFERAAWLVGATLADPAYDPWPSRSAITEVDMDADGKAAVTYAYVSSGKYSYVPANMLGTTRASQGYIASRVVFSLSGTLASCTQSTGSASVVSVEAHTLGCKLTSGAGCSSGQTGYLDDNGPDWRPQASSYALAKVSADATCAEVRAALP